MLWQAFGRWGAITAAVPGGPAGPVPTYESAGTQVDEFSNTSITIPLPASTLADDICILHMVHLGAPNPPAPTGWTKIAEHTRSGTFTVQMTLMARRLDGSEGANVVVNTGAAVTRFAVSTAYRGITTANPFYESVVYDSGVNTPATCGTVTTTGENRLILDFFGSQNNKSFTAASRTEKYELFSFLNSDTTLGLISGDAVGTGAQAAESFTMIGTADWVTASLALIPAAA